MSFLQAVKPMIRKEVVWPSNSTAEPQSIMPIAFYQHPPQTLADASVIGFEDVPGTVAKIIEPALKDPVDSLK